MDTCLWGRTHTILREKATTGQWQGIFERNSDDCEFWVRQGSHRVLLPLNTVRCCALRGRSKASAVSCLVLQPNTQWCSWAHAHVCFTAHTCFLHVWSIKNVQWQKEPEAKDYLCKQHQVLSCLYVVGRNHDINSVLRSTLAHLSLTEPCYKNKFFC